MYFGYFYDIIYFIKFYNTIILWKYKVFVKKKYKFYVWILYS